VTLLFWNRLHRKLDEILEHLEIANRRIATMSTQLDVLKLQIAKNTTLIGGALALIGGLRQQIIDAGTDPAALQEIIDSLARDDAALADALVVNTPAEPEVPATLAAPPETTT
jgi:hypothetical protein